MRISDWSSDVCSSDLALGGDAFELVARIPHQPAIGVADRERARAISVERVVDQPAVGAELRRSIGILLVAHGPGHGQARSAERRVGKEWFGPCSSRMSPDHKKQIIQNNTYTNK